YGCTLQGGGSDQWGNILSGVDLIRRRHGAQVHAITWPLVEGSDGKKFSKSAGNAPWLDPALTSPFEYYQWWLNTDDRDVERFLRDRKSTRLNSSHVKISYAVFCLKKKKTVN